MKRSTLLIGLAGCVGRALGLLIALLAASGVWSAVAHAATPRPRVALVTDLQPVRIAKSGAYSTAVAILPARGDAPVRIVAGDQRGGLIVVRRGRDGRFGRFVRRNDIDIHALAVADLDGDGRDDLVSGGSPGDDGLAASVRWGGRGGRLGKARRLGMPALEGGAAAWVNELRVADVDGDGRRDIVTANLVGGSNPRPGAGVAVLHNRGHRRFALTTPTTLRSGEDLAVADLNGDGRRDLFVNGRAYLRRSNGRFVAGRRHGDHVVNFSELADLDADGRADLLYSLNQRLVVRHGARRGFGESDGFAWPQRDGLKWPHLALVDVLIG